MDFDLFELDDDFLWALSATCIDQPEKTEIIYQYPMLNCSITTENNSFSEESFITNLFIWKDNYQYCTSAVGLTNYGFSKGALSVKEILQNIIRQGRMYIQMLITSLKKPLDCDAQFYFEQRKQITLMYHTLLTHNNLVSKHIKENLVNIRKLLNSVVNKEILTLCTTTQNEGKGAGYHLLHGFLEWRFLDLIISKETQNVFPNSETNNEFGEFLQLYKALMSELVIISFSYFSKNKVTDIIKICCFPCMCIKEMWLLLQFLSEKYEKELNFWKSFLACIENNRQIYDKCTLPKQDLLLFEIWLTKGVLILEGYKMNGVFEGPTCSRTSKNSELVEKLTELFLRLEPSDEQIRILLITLMPLILEWCTPKADIPMMLWEYFYKRINSSLYVANSSFSLTGKDYFERIKSLLVNDIMPTIHSSNYSSFSLYIMILGKIIEKFIHTSQINQIYKVLGRIFVKFSVSKLLSLNEVGIHHIIELFLMLALSSQLEEIAYKLRDNLMSIALEKITLDQRICITKGHMALLMHFFELNINTRDYISKLLEQLSSIHNEPAVSRIIVIGMCDILRESKHFSNGEHLFIGSWLSNFLNICTSTEMENILRVFHSVFKKIEPVTKHVDNNFTDASINLFNALSNHILPFIERSLSTTSSSWIPLLAADFCILIASYNSQQQFQSQLESFIEVSSCNIRSTLKFLLAILDCSYVSLVNSTIIIQLWLKSLVLLSANDEYVVALTKKVTELQEFQNVSNLQVDDLLFSKEPLFAFIIAVGKNYDTCDNLIKKSQIANKFNSYLMSFDKWILHKKEKIDVSYRFYRFIAIVVFNCINIVYIRSKITCFFHIAITRFILPCSVQVGKFPDIKICQIIQKIWPVIIQGIGKLSFNVDPYINKTLSDLIIKWTPYFKVNAKPFVCCIENDNEPLSFFIFEKLASIFLTTQKRQPQSNALNVIAIFKEVVTEIANSEAKMNIFIKSTTFVIFEHLMMVDTFVPTNKMLLDLFAKITKAVRQLNSQILRTVLAEKIKLIVVKHLAHCSTFCFQLLTQIARIFLELIEEILPFLEGQIKVVEEKRGSDHDNRLRNCFQQLNETILVINMKQNEKQNT